MSASHGRGIRWICAGVRVLVFLSLVWASGCGGEKRYPEQDYFHDRKGWQKVVKSWRRRYKHSFVHIPEQPHAEEYISSKLSQKKSYRVAVLGVIREPIRIENRTAPRPSLGGGSEKRCRQLRWGRGRDQVISAAAEVDVRQDVFTALEQSLARSQPFSIVDRSVLKLVLEERDLRQLFSESTDMGKIKGIKGADLIVVASVAEREYVVYSMSEDDESKPRLSYKRTGEARVRVRMIDVSDGSLVWSASIRFRPGHFLLVPVITSRKASEKLPSALTSLPHGDFAKWAARYLVEHLVWRLSGKSGDLPAEQRVILQNHRGREWLPEDRREKK